MTGNYACTQIQQLQPRGTRNGKNLSRSTATICRADQTCDTAKARRSNASPVRKQYFDWKKNKRRWYPTPAIAASWDPKWRELVYVDCKYFKRGPDMKRKGQPKCGTSVRCHGDRHSVYRVVGSEIRGYPNPAVAASWDPHWAKAARIDCRHIKRGPPMRHRNGASIKCYGNSHAVFRLWGNEMRWYPNAHIAASWDSKYAQYVPIDCRGIKRGPNMRHRNGAAIGCNGNKHAVFRLWGNEIRGYPNPHIAASWDRHWTQFVQMDCRGLKRKPNMRHRNGASIKCVGNRHAVFRLWGNERRWYPNPLIASSWDPKWTQFVQMDCRHIRQSYHMRHRNGASIKCVGNKHAVFRLWGNERRWYPNAHIAASWDPKWAQFVHIDCRRIRQSHHMRHRNGASIRCNGNRHGVYRLWGNERRGYPNPAVAASWDPKWAQFIQMDCRHIKEKPNVRHRNGASIKCVGIKHAVFRLWGNERRWYPNAAIASSWDPKWTQYVYMDCRRIRQSYHMRHRNGASIRCGKGGAIFRLWGNEIRAYPNLPIAASWDRHWAQFIQLDCRRFKRGPNMRHRNGASIRCNGKGGAVFRLWGNEMRWYPNSHIAASWDSKWAQFIQLDCKRIKRGPNMRHREGSPVKCIGNKHTVFRVVGNQIRPYPNPTIASSWDAWWSHYVHMDCRHFKRGWNVRHRNGSSIKCIGEKHSSIYRLWKDERRRYPNAVVANSWDKKWREYMPIDCRRIRKGPDMVKQGHCNLRGYV